MKTFGKILPWLLVAALAAWTWWRQSPASAVRVTEAVATKQVEVSVETLDSEGQSARVTLRRPQGISGRIHLLLPAGTVFNSGSQVQRLMLAKPVLVDLDDDSPEATRTVATYCIDEFRTAPEEGVALALGPGEGSAGGGGYTVEDEPLHKLADCLDGMDLPASDKQLAVWAVSEHLIDMPIKQAVETIEKGLAAKMTQERQAQLEAKREDIKARHHLDDATISEIFAGELKKGQADLEGVAKDKADQQVLTFVTNDQKAMSACGYPVATLQLFQ